MARYFDLQLKDQKLALDLAARGSGLPMAVLEKDIWLTLVLGLLFSMPGAKPMAFKGGTSLSKVFGAIKRFSEDVDVTVDYKSLGLDVTVAELAEKSNRDKDRASEALKAQLALHINQVVIPYLNRELSKLPGCKDFYIEVDEAGEQVRVFYPSHEARHPDPYLKEFVLVEFGGRNEVVPNGDYEIVPDAAKHVPTVEFPKAMVTVLAGERTFWEKATLIHALCNRDFPQGAKRNSRHWYDLAMLADHACGKVALQDLDLLQDVVDLKRTFYRQNSARYELCLTGELILVPTGDNLVKLRDDYDQMIESGMMDSNEMPMDEILERLGILQDEINNLARAWNIEQVGTAEAEAAL